MVRPPCALSQLLEVSGDYRKGFGAGPDRLFGAHHILVRAFLCETDIGYFGLGFPTRLSFKGEHGPYLIYDRVPQTNLQLRNLHSTPYMYTLG